MGGLRDGGLSKSENMRGERPFFLRFWISQVVFGPFFCNFCVDNGKLDFLWPPQQFMLVPFFREDLKGQTKWDKRVSPVSCGFLRKSVKFCASENQQKSVKICAPKKVREDFCFIDFPAIAVFSANLSEGINSLRSLRKERETQKSSLISKEKVNKDMCFLDNPYPFD